MQDHVHPHDSARDGSSDATPGGMPGKRRPGELLFTVFLVLFSGVLLWNAFGISGFEALSGPGAVPMATAAVMLVSALIVLVRTLPLPRTTDETVMRDILPPLAIVIVLLLVGALIGAAGGSLQAASRTLLVDQVDKERVTEAFGLYALSGKATAFMGPALLAWVTVAFGSQRAGMATILVFFVVGLAILSGVPDRRR